MIRRRAGGRPGSVGLAAVLIWLLVAACSDPAPPGTVAAETTAAGTVAGVQVRETAPATSVPLTGARSTGPVSTTKIVETTGTTSASILYPEVSVLGALPHDPTAFTQGLVLRGGRLYESTGLYGRSTVRIVDPAGGEIVASVELDDRYFGEGLEVVGDRVVQLTWKSGTAFIWDAETLAPLGTYSYEGEGWGLCAFEDRFVMTDGTAELTLRDLDTFEVIGRVKVVLQGRPIDRLNELECVEDLVYANVWQTDYIMVIAPLSGQVVARVDASSLQDHLTSTDGIDVLNGIAYDHDRGVFYLTGKLWPNIFETRINFEDS